MNKKTAIIVALLAVAVTIGFMAVNHWPPGSGTEASIGAANRYQSNQIGSGDVTVSDAQLQAFLQTDLFHKYDARPRGSHARPR